MGRIACQKDTHFSFFCSFEWVLEAPGGGCSAPPSRKDSPCLPRKTPRRRFNNKQNRGNITNNAKSLFRSAGKSRVDTFHPPFMHNSTPPVTGQGWRGFPRVPWVQAFCKPHSAIYCKRDSLPWLTARSGRWKRQECHGMRSRNWQNQREQHYDRMDPKGSRGRHDCLDKKVVLPLGSFLSHRPPGLPLPS